MMQKIYYGCLMMGLASLLYAGTEVPSSIDQTSVNLIQDAVVALEKKEVKERASEKVVQEEIEDVVAQASEIVEQTKQEVVAEKELERVEKKGLGSMKAENSEVADIYLNFEEVSLASLVHYITDRTNLNILPEKNLEQIKVPLVTNTPYTLNQALALLHTLLEKNGYSMIEVAGVQRIVPRNTAFQHPLPFYSSAKGIEPEDLPDTDALIKYMYYLKNIKASMSRDILVNILGDQAVEMQQDLDVIIMTQKSNSIKFAMKLIKELDQGGLRQTIKMIKLQHTDPEVIARLFNEKIIGRKQEQESIRFASAAGKKESSYFSSSTKIIADSERFYLILMGQEQDIDRIIDFVYIFDRPDDAEDSRLWTVNLKYIEADRAKVLIERAIVPPKNTTDKDSLMSFKLFEDVVISAETPKSGDQANYGSGNRLLIACNKEVRPALKKLIDSIDKKYPQIAIEMMIVDVTQRMARELSAQLRNRTADMLGTDIAFQTAHASERTGVTNLDSNLASLVGSEGAAVQGAVLTAGDPGSSLDSGNIWLYLRALLAEKQVNILSQPFLIVNNREPCYIQSNDIRRVDGDFVGSTGVRGNIAKVDLQANTLINITPRINADGVVDLTIKISLEEFIEDAQSDQPSRQIRRLDTRASMAEGQVLVLGGLNRSQQNQNFWHTPGVEKIPIIGNLFKGRERRHDKQNLFVFIRPSIIKPRDEGNPDDYTQMKIDYAKYQVLNVDAYSASKDPIQRWFFKPRNQDVKQRMNDVKAGIFRPIDDFKEGKEQPAEVDIQNDAYYQDSLKLNVEKKRKAFKRKIKEEEERPEPIVFVKDAKKNIKTQKNDTSKERLVLRKPVENKVNGTQKTEHQKQALAKSPSDIFLKPELKKRTHTV